MTASSSTTPMTGRRRSSTQGIRKRAAIPGGSDSMAYLQISGAAEEMPVEMEVDDTSIDTSFAVDSPAPSTCQQPTITKLTYQGRVLWTQATAETVSANLERMGLTPGKYASSIGDPIPSPPSSAPSTPPSSAPGSCASTPSTSPSTTPPGSQPASPPVSPPTSPGPPPNSPRRLVSINTRYRVPGTQLTVYHRRGETHIVGSGRTPWIKKGSTVCG